MRRVGVAAEAVVVVVVLTAASPVLLTYAGMAGVSLVVDRAAARWRARREALRAARGWRG